MRRVAAAVLIVLFTFSTAVPGICSQIEHPLDLQENQSLADWELGSGNFNGLSQTFVVAGEPLKHVVADLNNDSRPDIAVIYNASFRIDIFYNDANGRFNYSDRTTIDMPGPVTDIAAGDVNKDLKQDLVVSCNVTGNDVFVLSQANNFDKNAPLYAIPTASKPRALILQDLNGDSWLDIATLYYGDPPDYLPGFEVRLKSEDYDSAGSFPLYMDPLNMQQPSLFTSGDFNQDGRSDLVIGDRAIGKVVGFINGAPSGKVWTNTTNLIPANAPSALCMAQLIAGGGMDLMVAEEDSSIINIWRYSDGTFNLRTNVMDQESITSLATTDVNGDSRLDLVSVSASKHNLTVFRASTSLLYGHSNSLAFPVPYHPVHVIAYDMDSAGSEDLVVSSRASTGYGAISIYYRNGQEISNADLNRIVKDIFPTLMTLGNFNGIGNNEIAVYDPTGPTISFINEASNPGCPSAPSGILAIKSGDLDGDGYDDIAMMTANNVTVWFGGPDIFSGASRKVTVESTLPGLSSLFLGDLNNDSRLDVAVGASGGVESFWNSGTGTLYSEAQRFTLSLPGASVTSLATVTIRGAVHNDSRADLVVLNSTASRLEIYYQQSAGSVFTAASRSYLNVISGLYHLRAGDLNSDGLGDLAVLSPGKVNIYLQNPSYSQGFSGSQPIVAIDVPDGPRALELGDLDDDGALDIAIVTENSTLIAYGHDGPSFSLLTRQTAGAAPVLLSVGEMNGDGKDDLVTYSVASRAVSFYHQNNFPPIAMAAVEGTGHLEGGPVWFNAYGSTDSYSDRDHLSYHWDFADGGVANGERVLYVFQVDGLYNVTLSVSDPWGGWDDAVVQVSIGDRAPTANFTFQSVPAPVEGSPVTFTDLSTTPVDPIKRWEWDFGDGTVLNRTDNQPVQHIFGENGAFTVTLTVFDKDGSSNSVEKQLTVLDSAPDAAFSVSDYRPIEGQEVTFRDWSNRTADAIKSWSWDFGDGTWANVSGGDLQHHAYLRNGAYSVTLVVVDIDGSEDSITKEVVVLNSVPVADFEPSLSTPNEGQQVSFVDASTSFNPMVRWSWDMGDGTWCNGTSAETVLYMYRNNGTYIATLTVEDSDGDVQSISKPIIVRDTSPTIVRLYTMDGGSSYREWDNVSFGVVATPGWEDISVYQWDFQTTVFQADEGTALNSTYHRFLSPGPYKVTVRVWDTDSYAEAYIMLTITDPAPVPDFTATVTGHDRNVSFSAALTVDTENDMPILKYRWFFGDGNRTDWSSYFEVDHAYQQDGVYSVRLEVRDDHNSAVMKTKNVTIDLLPPEISIDAPVLRAVVGEPTLIKVRVTDLVGVRSVILEYTFENATRSVAMTPEGGGIYFAQVPAQNRTGELTYRVTAVDKAGHASSTEWFTVALEYEDPTLFIVTTALLLIALLIVIAYLVLTRPIVDEVFVMYQDGTLLAHQTRRLKPGMDDEILGGMLIALQSFVRDSFKDEGATVLKRMDFGDRKLLVERKDGFFMAVVLSGKRAGNSAQRMRRVLDRIEERYADVLRDWDGDLEKVRGIRDETKLMFQRTNPLERLRRREGDEGST